MALLFALKCGISLQHAVAIFEEAGQRNVSPNPGFQQKLCEYERRELRCDNTVKTWSGAADIDGNLFGRRGVTNPRRSQGIFSSSSAASSVADDLSVFGKSTLPGDATTFSVLDSVVASASASVLPALTAPLSVESPTTFSVLDSVVASATASVSDSAAAPGTASVLPALTAPLSVESPTTLSVLDSVVAPVTASVSDSAAAPATASVLKAVQLDAAAARAQLELQHEAIALERQALLQAQAAKRARHVAEAASAAVIMIFCKYPAFCA